MQACAYMSVCYNTYREYLLVWLSRLAIWENIMSSTCCAITIANPTSPALTGRVMNWMSRVPSVQLIQHVLGPDPIICIIESDNVDEFRNDIDKIKRCPYLRSIDSRMLLVTDSAPFWNDGVEVVLEEYMAWIFLSMNGGQHGDILQIRRMPGVVGTRSFDSGPDDGVALVQFSKLKELIALTRAFRDVGVTRVVISIAAPRY